MSAVGMLIGSLAARLIANRVIPKLGGIEPGRYPHPVYGPIVIPVKPPPLQPGDPSPYVPPVQITPWGFYIAFAGVLWYAARKTSPAHLGRDVEGLEPELFPGLRRELRLEPEESATSDDPVEQCLERRYGWNLTRMRTIRDSIASKETPDIFTKETGKLTGEEAQLLEQIEDCLDRVAKQFGSMEAAGLPLVACDACGDGDEETAASEDVAGPVMTCLKFDKRGKCVKFAPTCEPPGLPCITESPPRGGGKELNLMDWERAEIVRDYRRMKAGEISDEAFYRGVVAELTHGRSEWIKEKDTGYCWRVTSELEYCATPQGLQMGENFETWAQIESGGPVS